MPKINFHEYYIHGASLKPIIQKVPYHAILKCALSAYMIANSGSISPVIDLLFIFPSRYSLLSLNIYT